MLALVAALAVSAAVRPEGLDAVLRDVPAGGLRTAAVARLFVTSPYLASPLGEGEGPDPDPRIRLDAFDCMTLVETAVALGSAGCDDDAALALDDIRYGDERTRAGRNHEVLSQWLPRNIAKGWVEDVSRALAGGAAPVAAKVYTPETWTAVLAAGRGIKGVPRARLPLGHFETAFVPAAAVASVAPRVPAGAIVLTVRADAPLRATRITHAGIVTVGRGGTRNVVHATSSRGVGRVIEEPLARFLRRQSRAFASRWPLEGLAFVAVRDNRTRLAALVRHGHLSRRSTRAGASPLADPPDANRPAGL